MRTIFRVCSAIALSICVMSNVADFSTVSMASNIAAYDVAPITTYLTGYSAGLKISGSSATIQASAIGTAGVTTKAKVTATLQRQSSSGSWTSVETWTNSSSNSSVSLKKSHSVSSNHTYRVKAVCKAYQHGSWESTTVYSSKIST